MATLEELQDALVNADKAGDTAAATVLADAIHGMRQPKAEPTTRQKVQASMPGRVVQGVRDPIDAGAQLLPRALSAVTSGFGAFPNRVSNFLDSEAKRVDTMNKGNEQAYQEARQATGSEGIDAMRIAGNVVSPVNKVLPVGGATVAAQVGRGALSGALSGGMQPVQDTENFWTEKAKQVGFGAGLGAIANPLGGVIADKITNSRVQSANLARDQNAVRDLTLQSGKQAGYVVPPSTVNPSTTNKIVEGLAGKINTEQGAAIKNQQITNVLARRTLGLADDTPVTPETLRAIRSNAGEAYEAVRNTGRVVADDAFKAKLDSIKAPFEAAAKDFPELAKSEVVDLVQGARKEAFDANSAVDMVKILRAKADAAYAKGDKAVGKGAKEAANALEDMLGRHLEKIGAPADMLAAYQGARQTIAQTYSIEKALNPATGNIVSKKLAGQLAKGKPLSGDLKTAAEFGQAFPRATQEVTRSMPGVSPLDFYGAGGISAMTGNPAMLGLIGARPAARAAALSAPYQGLLANPNYRPSLLLPNTLRAVGSAPAIPGLLAGQLAE